MGCNVGSKDSWRSLWTGRGRVLGGLGDVSCPGRTTSRGTAREAPQSKIGRPRPARRAGGVDSALASRRGRWFGRRVLAMVAVAATRCRDGALGLWGSSFKRAAAHCNCLQRRRRRRLSSVARVHSAHEPANRASRGPPQAPARLKITPRRERSRREWAGSVWWW